MITIPFTGSRSKSVKYFRLQLLFFFVFRFFIYLNAYGIMLLNAMLSTWGGGEEHSIFYYYNSELASITGGGETAFEISFDRFPHPLRFCSRERTRRYIFLT